MAAAVHGRADDPDALPAGFLRDLHAQGFDAVGVVPLFRRRWTTRPNGAKAQGFAPRTTAWTSPSASVTTKPASVSMP